MHCVTCLGIRIEEVLSGKSYQHLTLGELQLSATNGCPLCAFLLQHVSPALRRSLALGEILGIFLERHSIQYRFERTFLNTDEYQRLNDEDDNFRDAMIGVQSGYSSTLIAVVGRPELAPPLGATVEEREVCYVTMELCTESGSIVKKFCRKNIANSQQEKEKKSLKRMLLDLSDKIHAIQGAMSLYLAGSRPVGRITIAHLRPILSFLPVF